MSSGFFALLDDIAALAKLAAASIDDISVAAMKASAKSAGVVIDDAAVTPQYVKNLPPARELPIIRKITVGSLKNKFLFIIPAAMLLTWLAPWALPILLIIGGSYLCYEGAEKVWHWVKPHNTHHEDATAEEIITDIAEKERTVVKKAVRTDLILSTEIMLISLANVELESWLQRLGVLAVIAIIMTVAVYGTVAVLIKLDDFGLFLAKKNITGVSQFGTGLVKVMPYVFNVLGVVGTIAMLWVGGHILIQSSHDLGFTLLYTLLHAVTDVVHVAGPVVTWFVDSILSAILGIIAGGIIMVVMVGVKKVRKRKAVTK